MTQRQKKNLMLIICWMAVIAVGLVAYLGFVDEGIRFILYCCALIVLGERFVGWLEK